MKKKYTIFLHSVILNKNFYFSVFLFKWKNIYFSDRKSNTQQIQICGIDFLFISMKKDARSMNHLVPNAYFEIYNLS